MKVRGPWFAAALVCAGALAAGCGGTPSSQCMSMGGSGDVVTGAKLFRLDVYGDGARCDGPRLAAGAPAPELQHTFRPGEPVTLDIPPGHRVLLLTPFADLAA